MSSLTTTHDVCPQEPAPSNGASLSLSEDLFAKFKAMTIPEWADEINYAWDRVIKDVIKAGQLLLACKDLVPHGQWERLFCKGVLRMTRQTAFRLMAIAKHPVLSNSTHVQQLPRSWGTLYELSQLPSDAVQALLETSKIHQELTRKEAVALVHPGQINPQSPIYVEGPVGMEKKVRTYPMVIESLEDTQKKVRAYLLMLAEELTVISEPLVLDKQGWILSGGYWVPPFVNLVVAPKPEPKPKHRCECGHEHVDRRLPR